MTAIYFNPIFDAGSNHSYDTQDYYKVDPYFGTNGDFKNLVKQAEKRGIRIILDGVFNHMSSDSPLFDRYGNHKDNEHPGACESASSEWRNWFTFRPPAGSEPSPCAPSTPGGTDTYYDGWFGFDSIPVLTKTLPAVQDYFLTGADSVSRYWLKQGAEGWRLDVMGDSSFPDGYWQSFRNVVKGDRPERADRRRAVAEGLDAAALPSRRPRRHDDELPAPRRGARAARARRVRPEGVRRQRPARSRRRQFAARIAVDPGGLPRGGGPDC